MCNHQALPFFYFFCFFCGFRLLDNFWDNFCDSSRTTRGTDVAMVSKYPHCRVLFETSGGKVFAPTRHSQWLISLIVLAKLLIENELLGVRMWRWCQNIHIVAVFLTPPVEKYLHLPGTQSGLNQKFNQNKGLIFLHAVPGGCKYFSTGGVVFR